MTAGNKLVKNEVVVSKVEDSLDVSNVNGNGDTGGGGDGKDESDDSSYVFVSGGGFYIVSKFDLGEEADLFKKEENGGISAGDRLDVEINGVEDESFREQIISAQLLVKEKTDLRDAIQDQIIEIRDVLRSHIEAYKAARLEETAARQLVRLKRQEIDSVQDKINRFKNAMSVEDADGRILSIEKIIQHETLVLKDEKQFIREMKQLKFFRDQLALNMGTPEEVRQAIDKKDQNEERMKTLRKELESLKNKVSKAEAVVKKYDEDRRRERELHAQFRAVDDICQKAYALFNNLKTLSYDKNKNFRLYNSYHAEILINAKSPLESDVATVTDFPVVTEPIHNKKKEENTLTKVEIGLAWKAEELKKEEIAAQLKEQRRLEEKAEALDNKKRIAKMAQMRAELRARKEAEQKEKEREKRMRKKEKKAGDGSINGEEPASSESSNEITTKEIETLVKVNAKKKTQKPPAHFFSKQLKPKPIPPPPLINRNKKQWKQWKLWGKVVLAVVAIIALVYVLS